MINLIWSREDYVLYENRDKQAEWSDALDNF